MTAATALPPEAATYLAAVRRALADLPAGERDDLLVEVEVSLVEAADEPGSIAARLGPPEEFAAELRAAAGLHAEPAPTRSPQPRALIVLRERTRRALADRRVAAARGVARELAPIWWLARGYLAVAAAAYAFDRDWMFDAWPAGAPVVPRAHTVVWGLLVIASAIVVSVAIGLLARRRPTPFPRLAFLVNAALLLAALPVVEEIRNRNGIDPRVGTTAPAPLLPNGLVYNGQPVTNIYPYTRDGKLLHDVLLYDGAGVPLDIPGSRAIDPNRRFVVTNGNRPLFNAFPIRYYEPGTRGVARPNAAPYIEHPFVITPPLDTR